MQTITTSREAIMFDRYELFFDEVFLNEGLFQADPHDKGNYYKGQLLGTIAGVTARDHYKDFKILKELYDMQLFNAVKKHAMNFYKRKGYWKDGFNEISDSSLAFKLFDLGVNMGEKTSIKILQKVLNKHYGYDILPSGILTNETIQFANQAYLLPPKSKIHCELIKGESVLYSLYIHETKKYYKSLKGFGKFGKGWLRRLAKILNANDKVYLTIEARPPEKIRGMV